VRERVGQYDLADAVVVVSITGDGDPVTPATIEEYADEEGALVARVTDHRELADESEVDVSFSDPDEAVRQRIRELGLSPAARDLDETIRASKVADSNVADTVEERVTEFVADADAGAFEAADDGTGAETPAADGTADSEASEEPTADADDREDDAGEDGQGADTQGEDDQVTMEDYL
jgi:exonuclease SbcD